MRSLMPLAVELLVGHVLFVETWEGTGLHLKATKDKLNIENKKRISALAGLNRAGTPRPYADECFGQLIKVRLMSRWLSIPQMRIQKDDTEYDSADLLKFSYNSF